MKDENQEAETVQVVIEADLKVNGEGDLKDGEAERVAERVAGMIGGIVGRVVREQNAPASGADHFPGEPTTFVVNRNGGGVTQILTRDLARMNRLFSSSEKMDEWMEDLAAYFRWVVLNGHVNQAVASCLDVDGLVILTVRHPPGGAGPSVELDDCYAERPGLSDEYVLRVRDVLTRVHRATSAAVDAWGAETGMRCVSRETGGPDDAPDGAS